LHVIVEKQNFCNDFQLLFEALLICLKIKLLEHSFFTVVLNRLTAKHNRLLTESVLLTDNKREKQINIGSKLNLVFVLVVKVCVVSLIAVFQLL
jgi:hypothetical protein